MQQQHQIQEAPWMQKSISMTLGFAGVGLLGFRVPGLGFSSLRSKPSKQNPKP